MVRAKAIQKPKVLAVLRALVRDALVAPQPSLPGALRRHGALLDVPALPLDDRHGDGCEAASCSGCPSCTYGFEGSRTHAYDNEETDKLNRSGSAKKRKTA